MGERSWPHSQRAIQTLFCWKDWSVPHV